MTMNSFSPGAVRMLLCGNELRESVLLVVVRCCEDMVAQSELEISASDFRV